VKRRLQKDELSYLIVNKTVTINIRPGSVSLTTLANQACQKEGCWKNRWAIDTKKVPLFSSWDKKQFLVFLTDKTAFRLIIY